MESFLGTIQLPFQRRLTKMYNDTKSNYDFVKELIPSAADPEMVSLHRKLKIQKDRLVSWGLEWSDPGQSHDIDESINRAGLAELVGSVMSTIKDILAEVEPLWQSSKRPFGSQLEKSGIDSKIPVMVWDKSRFQDLIRDLTMSIDTLYDLSRTRQSARKSPTLKAEESTNSVLAKSRALEERLFESTRMQAPQQIDPKTLTWPRELKSIQPSMLPPAKSSRQIVFMRRPVSTAESRRSGAQSMPLVPVLLDHAPYDSIYSTTGITPSMSRFERLFAALSQAYISSDRVSSGLLRLIGYFEESEHSRFCLLFSLPNNFGPIDIESPRMPSITILSDLLYSHTLEPSLEVKYRLAKNIASAVFELHSKGVVHGNIVSSNILFIENQPQNQLDLSHVNLRQPFLSSFDLFSDNATDTSDLSESPNSLCRHPLDPRITRYTHLTAESKSLDLYSLAMLLLEIGLWNSLRDIFPTMSQIPPSPTEVFKILSARCGSIYTKAVQACWTAPEGEIAGKARADVMHQKVFCKVTNALDACCMIDDSWADSSDENDDTPVEFSTAAQTSQQPTPLKRMISDITPAFVAALTTPNASSTPPTKLEKPAAHSKSPSTFPEKMGWAEKHVQATPFTSTPNSNIERQKSKLRAYPSIEISKQHLDFWHNAMMPHINYVLRGFYKTHPESVEISLTSIGESPTTTKPTILVICTSVAKVRSILKKSLVYDKSIFGLTVCRGKVVRSRKHGTKRSMANNAGDRKAANGQHQHCPKNGASIGAYVNDKNLPPVSFGGLIMVDDKPYGMTVHHMLDDPSDNEDDEPEGQVPPLRSSAANTSMPDLTMSESSYNSSGDEEYMYSLSDYESDISSENESEFDDEDEDYTSDDEAEMEPGDIKGIPQGCGEGYMVTQPAIDDIGEDFYPNEETRDEDHLDSFQLGEVYASSGIRRRTEDNMVHEVDWALFEFDSERKPDGNHISGQRFCHSSTPGRYPVSVAPTSALGGLRVHSMGRTSGLQSGRILPGMVIVKIFGRQTPSQSYQVAGKLGVPGDSGAWVVDNENGRACGHVLAWSAKKKIAYICPMDVLVKDIGDTLHAQSIKLPGGEELLRPQASTRGKTTVHDPSNVHDELATMLAELNIELPPTPSEIDDHYVPAPHRSSSHAKSEIDDLPKSFIATTFSSHSPAPPLATQPPPPPSSLYSATTLNPNTFPEAQTLAANTKPRPAGSLPSRSPTSPLSDNPNYVPIRLMTLGSEPKVTALPREQHLSFVKAAQMSWPSTPVSDENQDDSSAVEADSALEGLNEVEVGESATSNIGVGVREQPPPRARIPPPPPPPRRQVGAV